MRVSGSEARAISAHLIGRDQPLEIRHATFVEINGVDHVVVALGEVGELGLVLAALQGPVVVDAVRLETSTSLLTAI